MTSQAQRPPEGVPWIWMTREFLASDAWRSANSSVIRFVSFLMLEHMNHAGTQNGNLKAPYRQLETFGISARRLAAAIRTAGDLGLVDSQRRGMRVATTYALTWLPLCDGTPATNRWRGFRKPKRGAAPVSKNRNLPDKGEAELPDKGKAVPLNLPDKGEADRSQRLPDKGKALLRNSYQGNLKRESHTAILQMPSQVRARLAPAAVEAEAKTVAWPRPSYCGGKCWGKRGGP
jgi:hypothetical protein